MFFTSSQPPRPAFLCAATTYDSCEGVRENPVEDTKVFEEQRPQCMNGS